MPEHKYDASRQTIGALLAANSTLVVPEWQRSYAWDSVQVALFWNDLLSFDAQYPGDNVDGQEYFLGSIVLVTGAREDLLLDGQQRLATATILLSALRDARAAHNHDAATRLQARHISDYDDATGATKYVLALNAYDREFFRAEVQDWPRGEAPKQTLKSHGLIRRARSYFTSELSKMAIALGGGQPAFEWHLRVSRILTNHFSMVVVRSADEDNAASVFETLNDRGIGLSTPDLLRNLLIRRAPDALSRKAVVSAWEQVLGVDDEVNVEQFLRHYWISHRGDVKARSLYREIKKVIQEENTQSLALSEDLARSAQLYRDLVTGKVDDAELKTSLEAVKALGASVLYPPLLSGYAAASEKQGPELRSLASNLVKVFVRYNVVAAGDTTMLERTVYEVARVLRGDRDFASATAALQALVPEASEFVVKFARVVVGRQKTARYILGELEASLRPTDELRVGGPDLVHVEHIYPQSPSGEERLEHHSSLVDRLGNLTLLSGRRNSGIKNSSFEVKKRAAYSMSEILLTRDLLKYDSWGADAIGVRQKELALQAFEVWKFPGETLDPKVLEGDNATHDADLEPEELPTVPEA